MMKSEEIIKYCCNKNKAYIDYPFGDIPICIKVNKKIFAQVYPLEQDYKITLKCEPTLGDFYRRLYPGIVVRGYHCPPVQQPYWNTIFIDKISNDELLNMIDHSYMRVITSFSKKIQRQLSEEAGSNFDETIQIDERELTSVLTGIFIKYSSKRICVVGTTCCGKSYLINKLSNCRDMDSEIFSLLNEEEIRIVCQTPWNTKIGKIMDGYVKENIKTKQMYPVFGTVVIESDITIYLNINEQLLKERCEKRGVNLLDAMKMKQSIENELRAINGNVIEICF